MNIILISFSTTATAVFGVYFKLQSFFFMPVFGLNNGLIPIVSYNYGAKYKDRMMKVIKLAMIYATMMMIIGIIVFETIFAVIYAHALRAAWPEPTMTAGLALLLAGVLLSLRAFRRQW